jgi:hypothetical protein
MIEVERRTCRLSASLHDASRVGQSTLDGRDRVFHSPPPIYEFLAWVRLDIHNWPGNNTSSDWVKSV